MISDGYGRKISLMIFILTHAIGGIVASLSSNVWAFLAGRILIAISLRGIGFTILTLLIEIIPSTKPQTASLLFQYNYVLGQFFAIILGYFIRDYRWNQLTISLIYLSFFMCWT